MILHFYFFNNDVFFFTFLILHVLVVFYFTFLTLKVLFYFYFYNITLLFLLLLLRLEEIGVEFFSVIIITTLITKCGHRVATQLST